MGQKDKNPIISDEGLANDDGKLSRLIKN